MNTIIEKIRAEVERLKEEHQVPTFRGDEYEEGGLNGYQLALDKVLAKLATLQEQPVDLEKEIEGWFNRLDNKYCRNVEEYYGNDIEDTARHFYELGRQSKEQPVEIEKNVRISPGMISNFGSSSFVLDVELTEEERTKLNIVPGFGGGTVKIKILCE